MNNFLNKLNDNQKKAVIHTEGPSLVIAGAGSGKTRVLTFRIAYLLSKKVAGSNILALTFTNKAAREMRVRIDKIVGANQTKDLWMGTFHSIFAKILRMESKTLGFSSNYTIYDTQDSKNVIKAIIKELQLDDQTYKPADALRRISFAKNNLISPEAYASSAAIYEKDKAAKKERMGEIYKKYKQRCIRAGAMDFDDLLFNTNVLLHNYPDILRKYQGLFKYILVDEYQDTNFAQYMIIKKLAEKTQNICVVGDDSQSIYSFRGAKIENILNFKSDYPNHKLYKLEHNYRSTQNIVEAANSLIEKNQKRIPKKSYTDNQAGDKIEVLRNINDHEEGWVVGNSIQESHLRHQLKFGDFAILYRTNAQSRIFEESLRKLNIPYKIFGSISFYQRKEIKDLLAYFRVIINTNDDEALLRIINYPLRGIGATTIEKINKVSQENNISIFHLIERLPELKHNLNKGTLTKLLSFTGMIKDLKSKLFSVDAYLLALEVTEKTGLLKHLKKDSTPENINRLENIEELINGIKDFVETNTIEDTTICLDQYIENIALLTDQDENGKDHSDKVSIMTIHAAKGLEFKQVYIVGAEEELFPSQRSVQSPTELEEERRLFYVALTRAEQKAYISYAKTRYRWGKLTQCRPSRFIKEISPVYLNMPAEETEIFTAQSNHIDSRMTPKPKPASIKPNLNIPKPIIKPKIKAEVKDFTPDDPRKIIPGMQVEHPRFGIGKVLNIEGDYPNTKATVFFQAAGHKSLLLKFAKLRILNE